MSYILLLQELQNLAQSNSNLKVIKLGKVCIKFIGIFSWMNFTFLNDEFIYLIDKEMNYHISM